MPFALLFAIAASLGIHAVALFGLDLDFSIEPGLPPLMAELRPLPKPPSTPSPQVEPVTPLEKPLPAKPRTPRRKAQAMARMASATPVLSVPQASSVDGARTMPAPEPEPVTQSVPETVLPVPVPVPVVPRLPSRGIIHYRIDFGDSNFEIGVSRNAWEIVDGHYRLTSVEEMTGLAWLIKAYRIEMESQGLITEDGFRPDSFALSRNGQASKEKAFFDWEKMKIRVGNQPDQALASGSQDFLSFLYQIGYMPNLTDGGALSVATGRKYEVYQLESLGDESVNLPAGEMRTLHLRVPGENMTEFWLAYDYLMLPVKIRHVDKKGRSFVQVATTIQLSPE